MKKSSKIFSFFAIALSAFLLFGSASNFKKASAESVSQYSKSVALNTIANLNVSSGDYYIEFGEYPQDEITGTDYDQILEEIRKVRNGGTDPRYFYPNSSTNNGTISYDKTSGYYTLLKAIGNYPVGTKVYEYVSGVNAYEKYPVYKYTSTGSINGKSITDSIRSLSANIENKTSKISENATTDAYGNQIDNQKPGYANYRKEITNGYTAGESYLFEVQPIKWRITGRNGYQLTLQSDLIIDSMYFNLYQNSGTNYGYSYLRNWLNYGSNYTNQNVYAIDETAGYSKTYSGSTVKVYLKDNIPMSQVGDFYTDSKDRKTFSSFTSNQNLSLTTSAYYTTKHSYSTTHSFYNMAFSSAEKSAMLATSKSYSGDHNTYQNSSVNTSNYVSIPSTTTSVRLGEGAYTQFAKATGLIVGLPNTDDSEANGNELPGSATYFNDFIYNGDDSTARGFFWTTEVGPWNWGWNKESGTYVNPAGSYSTRQYSRQSVFARPSTFEIIDGDVSISDPKAAANNRVEYGMVNQTAGVIPVIKIDIEKLLENESDVYALRSNEDKGTLNLSGVDFAETYVSEASSFTSGTTFFLTKTSKTATTDVKVSSYEINRTNKTLKVNMTGVPADFFTNGNYLRMVVTNSAPTNYLTNNSLQYVQEGLTFNIGEQTITDGTISFELSIANLGNISNNKDIHVYGYTMTLNETLITYITGSDLKSTTINLHKREDGSYSGQIFLYEGESKQLTSNLMTGGLYESWYTSLAGAAFTTQPTGDSPDYNAAGYVLEYDRVNGVTYNNGTTKLETNTIYSDYAGKPFDVKINSDKTESYVTDFMYVIHNGKEVNGTPLYNATSGKELTVTIRIKNPYISKAANYVDALTFHKGKGDSKVEILKSQIEILGPKEIYFDYTNVVKEVEYSFVFSSDITSEFTDGSDYAGGFIELITNLTSDDLLTEDDYKKDTYKIIEDNSQINFHNTVVTNSEQIPVYEDDSNAENIVKKTAIKNITYDSNITAQINLNTGYYVPLNKSNQLVMPTMTFKYNALVLDDDNYRLSETELYPNHYASEYYRESNIRLDNEGYGLDFDDNNNLKYYYSEDELVNNGGIYSPQSIAIYIVPTFTLYTSISASINGVSGFTSQQFALDIDEYNSTGKAIYYGSKDADTKYYKLVFNGSLDQWTYSVRIDGTENYADKTSTLKISRNLSNPNYQTSNDGVTVYYLTATYKVYSGSIQLGSEIETLNSTQDATYKYEKVSTSDQTFDLSPRRKASVCYNPWVEHITAVIPANTVKVNDEDGDKVFTGSLSTGDISRNWNFKSKMWYYIDKNGRPQSLLVDQGAGYKVFFDVDGDSRYTEGKDNLAFINAQDKLRYIKDDMGLMRRVICVDGISADIVYFLENKLQYEMGDNLNSTRDYSKNEILIKLNINHIVSDIEFSFSGAQAYNYEVKFTTNLGGAYILSEPFDAVYAFNPDNQDHTVFVQNNGSIQDGGNLTSAIDLTTYKDNGTTKEFIPFVFSKDGVTNHYFLAPKATVESKLANNKTYVSSTYEIYNFVNNNKILQFVGWELSSETINSLTPDCITRYGLKVEEIKNEFGYIEIDDLMASGFEFEFKNTFAVVEFKAVYQDMQFRIELEGWTPSPATKNDAIKDFLDNSTVVIDPNAINPNESYFNAPKANENTGINSDGEEATSTGFYSLQGVNYGENIFIGSNTANSRYNPGMVAVNNYISTDATKLKYGNFKGWYYVNNSAIYSTISQAIITSYDSMEAVIALVESQKNEGRQLFEREYLWADNNTVYYKTTSASTYGDCGAFFKLEALEDTGKVIITWYSKFEFSNGTDSSGTLIYSDMKLYGVFTTKMYTITGLDANTYSAQLVVDSNNSKKVLLEDDAVLKYTLTHAYSQSNFVPGEFSINGGTITLENPVDSLADGVAYPFTVNTAQGTVLNGTITVTHTTMIVGSNNMVVNTKYVTIVVKDVQEDITLTLNKTFNINTYKITLPTMLTATNTSGDEYRYGTFYQADGETVIDTSSNSYEFTKTHGTDDFMFYFYADSAFVQHITKNGSLKLYMDGVETELSFTTTGSIVVGSGVELQYYNNKYYIRNISSNIEVVFAGTITGGVDDHLYVLNSYKVVEETDNAQNNPANKYYNIEVSVPAEGNVVYGDDTTYTLKLNAPYTNTIPSMMFNNKNYRLLFANKYTYTTDTHQTIVKTSLSGTTIITKDDVNGYYYYTDAANNMFKFYFEESGAHRVTVTPNNGSETHYATISYSGNDIVVVLHNVTYAPRVYFSGAWDDNADMDDFGWTRNIYSVELPETRVESVASNKVFTTTYNSSEITLDGNSNSIYHGDDINFTMTMGAAFTQTLPRFTFVVGGETVTVELESLEGDTTTPGKVVYSYNENGVNLSIVLTYVNDTTFVGNEFESIITDADNIAAGLFPKRMYTEATYDITINIVEGMQVEVSNLTSVSELNKYIVAFNKGIETYSGSKVYIDNGALYYDGKQGEQVTGQSDIWKTFYYQLVNYGQPATNPFDIGEINTAFTTNIEGHTYAGDGNWNIKTSATASTSFAVATPIVVNSILLAPYTEEQYTVTASPVALASSTIVNAGKYTQFGMLRVNFTSSTWGNAAESNVEAIQSKTGVKFSETNKLKVSFKMYAAYDQSEVYFNLSKYGKILYPTSAGVQKMQENGTELSYYTTTTFTINNQSVSTIYIVDKSIDEANQIFKYYSSQTISETNQDNLLFTITITKHDVSRTSDTANTKTYSLQINRKIDAGTTLTISMDTSEIVSLNTYKVTLMGMNKSEVSDTSYGRGFLHNVLAISDGVNDTDWSVHKEISQHADTTSIYHGQNYVHNPADNQSIIGYSFLGWYSVMSNPSETTKIISNTDQNKTLSMTSDCVLYAQFADASASVGYQGGVMTITKDDGTVIGSYQPQYNTTSNYNEEITIKFILDTAFSKYDDLTFKVYLSSGAREVSAGANSTNLEGGEAYFTVDFEDGIYSIKLKYVRANIYIAIDNERSVVNSLTPNKYNVTVYNIFNYSSSYTAQLGFGEEFGFLSDMGIYNDPQTGEVKDEYSNIRLVFEDIDHGKTIKDSHTYKNAEIPSPSTMAMYGWRFVGFYVGESFEEVLKWYKGEYDTPEMKFSLDDYEIVGDFKVYPFYERVEYTVTLVETNVEESIHARDIELLWDFQGYTKSDLTFKVPYGYSLYSEFVGESGSIDAIMESIYEGTSSTTDPTYHIAHYTFDKIMYLSDAGIKFEDASISDFSVDKATIFDFIITRNIEIYLNFTREVYNIELRSAQSAGENLLANLENEEEISINGVTIVDGIIKVPYNVTIPDEILALAYNRLEVATGEHFNQWKNILDNKLLTETDIAEDAIFYAEPALNTYKIKVNSTHGEIALYINGNKVNANNGYVEVNFAQRFSISFAPEEGYTFNPPKFEVRLGTSTLTSEEFSNRYIIPGDDKKITNQFDKDLKEYVIDFKGYSINLDHATEMIVNITGTINMYELTTFVCPIITSDGLEFVFDGVGAYYNIDTKVVEFTAEMVEFGGTFRLRINLNKRFVEKSTIKFTLSDGKISENYIITPLTAPIGQTADGGMNVYEVSLDNVRGAVALTFDTTSVIKINEYTITFKVYYGGGVNGWTDLTNKVVGGTTYYNYESIIVKSEDLAVSTPVFPIDPIVENYTITNLNKQGWLIANNSNVSLSQITSSNINDNFTVFDNLGPFSKDITLYLFFNVVQKEVVTSTTDSSKGTLVSTGKADYRDENNAEISSGYKFSYELTDEYTQSIPVVSITGNGDYDIILISLDNLDKIQVNSTIEVNKSSSVVYVVTKTSTGYTYALKGALGAASENYSVSIVAGKYTILNGTNTIATANLTGNKFNVELTTVTESFNIAVNDSMFEQNAYTVKFVHIDGTEETKNVKHGAAVADIPTDSVNFIQKVVYVVTYEDGTTETYSAKEIGDVTFTQNATIEITAQINLVILIPIIVGVVAVIVVVVVVIVKVSKGKQDKSRTDKSNKAMFDKLSQAKGGNNDNQSQNPQGGAGAGTSQSSAGKSYYNPYLDQNKKDDSNNQ